MWTRGAVPRRVHQYMLKELTLELIMAIDKEEFKKYILEGKTIKELQLIYNCSRTSITEMKKKFDLVGLSPNSKIRDVSTEVKVCNECKIEYPINNFYSNGYTTTGKQKFKSKCKSCETNSIRDRFSDLIKDYLSTKNIEYSCVKCNYTNVIGSLDFHHIDPNSKKFEISTVSRSISVDRFIEEVIPELDKCELLCPNCHRLEHIFMGST